MLPKNEINTQPESLFESFKTLTTREFSFLTNLPEFEAITILKQLCLDGYIVKFSSRTGEIWKLNKKNF